MTRDPILEALAGLGATAPDHLLPAVLTGAGIADGYVTRPSVVGELLVAFGPRGVTSVGLADEFDPDEYLHRRGRQALALPAPPDPIARHLDTAIEAGRPGRLAVDLSSVTPFQAEVLRVAATIPRGEVRSYGWIAGRLGRPGAMRAVGTALASNPVPIIIPCHRVVRADGRLGDYSLGDPSNKGVLLEHEGLDLPELERLAARGVRLVAGAKTGVFCHPTCRHARRIARAHRVEFGSAAEAVAAGFRACEACRPLG